MFFRNLSYFLFVGLMLFLSVTFTGETPHAQTPYKFKVNVYLMCADINTGTLIQSYIKRELRSLGDVLVVGPRDAGYLLCITAVEPVFEATGRKTGKIAMGYVLLQKIGAHYSFPRLLPNLQVLAHDKEDLEGMCKSIVASIDTHNFEYTREFNREHGRLFQ